MSYESLAHEFFQVMQQVHGRNTQKRVSDSMNGENFVLSYISQHEGDVIPSDIANAMGTTSARIAAVLNSLEKKGMVTRRIDEIDRRRILVNLTDLGTEEVRIQDELRLSYVINMFKVLGEDDAKEYVRLTKKLADSSLEDFM
ncbi:hypothetical protein LF65_03580 [Clostridium beijerinckii]|uniref:Uncharacterized protein n=1 Tax=Clostridium beijerinckii TaxID=1520 RepID=A0A0B5QPE3_CLOBE|nr:MarR family transcriptional regulator [Clostridium beijerinckii]AJH00137.1 hypothetical protein LF65_03580 [Clostridium beijerinckii]OCA97809.1 hypothetical protein BGS1_01910 [Clostridium beijerinckii]